MLLTHLDSETEPAGGEPGRVVSVARRLRAHHDEQWQAEDLSRDAADDDAVVAKVKRRIDGMNVERSRMFDELDAWLSGELVQNPDAAPHTETIGSVVDRICIAWVRADRLSRKPNAEAMAVAARRQLTELAAAYDQLVSEVLTGRRRVPDWRALKSYGAGDDRG
ncbi:conserved hypothetical protein [Stackebrandtia nassauensis DSM 44728]|uniref:DUF4254 domain-containing protein n=2 Tax=Stackebrandtia TaxID=283810 RepID=D3PU88_STANL|nr:conserved hypothetical protein [Stackebrandtia nassauensis DSM 44728]